MQPLDLDEPVALAETARQNHANIVRVLDEYIATLKSLRDEIDGEEKKSLLVRLERILKGRSPMATNARGWRLADQRRLLSQKSLRPATVGCNSLAWGSCSTCVKKRKRKINAEIFLSA